jgi:transposase-like protein
MDEIRPNPSPGNPVCPKCGGTTRFEEKNTFTGREMREYLCTSCGYCVIEDRGTALWQILHDDRMAEAEAQRRKTKKAWWKFWGK